MTERRPTPGRPYTAEYFYDLTYYERGTLASCKRCNYKHNDNNPSDEEYLRNHLRERHPECYELVKETDEKDAREWEDYVKTGKLNLEAFNLKPNNNGGENKDGSK